MKVDRLISVCTEKMCKVWDTRVGKLSFEFSVLGASKGSDIVVSHDGKYVAMPNYHDNKIHVYDLSSGLLLMSKHFNEEVFCLIFGPSCSNRLIASMGGAIAILDVFTLEVLSSVYAHGQGIYSLAIDRTNRYLASSGLDFIISIWDLNDMICIKSFGNTERYPRLLSWNNYSTLLITCAEDNTVDIVCSLCFFFVDAV